MPKQDLPSPGEVNSFEDTSPSFQGADLYIQKLKGRNRVIINNLKVLQICQYFWISRTQLYRKINALNGKM